ncbi:MULTISPECIES: hypothetical protein [Nostoc]|nr:MULTISPECIES: hypothetical protein [Nostoc]
MGHWAWGIGHLLFFPLPIFPSPMPNHKKEGQACCRWLIPSADP